jgi:RND family efflux transporter MFP subunit
VSARRAFALKRFFSKQRHLLTTSLLVSRRKIDMDKLLFLWRCGVAALLALTAWGVSTSARAAISTQTGSYRVELSTDPAVVPVGRAKLVIKLRDAFGQPVTGATVSTLARMPGMPMGEREQIALPQPDAPGTYLAPAAFPMDGPYAVDLEIRGAQGAATVSVPLQTGQDTTQSGGFFLLELWPWIAGVLVLLFVLYRMRRSGQRLEVRGVLNRQVLLSLFLLAVMIAISLIAIRKFRRPGAMTPLEAQAMNMEMPAPAGSLPVELATVRRGAIQSTVRYTGQAVGFVEQDVNPRVTGLIEWMPFYPGDRVRKGQLLARLDTSEYQPQVAEARAGVGQAKQEVKVARSLREEAAAEAERAAAEAGMKAGALQEANSNRGKDVAAVAAARGAWQEAQGKAQKAMAQIEANRHALAEAHSGQQRTRAALREAQSTLEASRAAAAQAQSDTEAAREERAAAQAQATAIKTNIDEAQAGVQAARADLEYRQKEIARMKILLEQGVISSDRYQSEQAQSENADARLKATEARLAQANAAATAAQAIERRAAAMVGSAQAKAQSAQSAIESSAARIAAARSEVTASDARTKRAEANIRSAQAAAKAAAGRALKAQAGVRMARAEVGAAQARIQQAVSDEMAHHAHLHAAQSAEITADARISAAQAGVGQATAQFSEATTKLGYTEIRSLINGVVTQRLISPGVLVQPGQAILKLAQIHPIRVQANVAESDLAKIHVGSLVTVHAPDNPKRTITARVSSLAPAVDPDARTGLVEAILANPGEKFLPGQYVVMEIATGQNTHALYVPSRAIEWRAAPADGVLPSSSQASVWVTEAAAGADNQFSVRRVSVQTGASDGENTAIVSGLEEGQRVVLVGQQNLQNGDRVAAVRPGLKARESGDKEMAAHSSKRTQTAAVAVTERGYEPSTLTLRANQSERIIFTRKTDATCGTEVLLPEYGIRKELPLNTPVVVEFMPQKTGVITFTCGMKMLQGKVVVR